MELILIVHKMLLRRKVNFRLTLIVEWSWRLRLMDVINLIIMSVIFISEMTGARGRS